MYSYCGSVFVTELHYLHYSSFNFTDTSNKSMTVTVKTVMAMSSTSEIKITNGPPVLPVGVTIAVMFVLPVTVVALLFLVYYKRKRSALVNLTKPHKGSEENSYASSEHSHQQGSKYSESPEPGYDVINVKTKIVSPKFKSDVNPTHPSEYASIDNNCNLLHYSETSSSHTTIIYHISSCDYSAPYIKDSPLINSQKCGEMKQEVFIVDNEIEKEKINKNS